MREKAPVSLSHVRLKGGKCYLKIKFGVLYIRLNILFMEMRLFLWLEAPENLGDMLGLYPGTRKEPAQRGASRTLWKSPIPCGQCGVQFLSYIKCTYLFTIFSLISRSRFFLSITKAHKFCAFYFIPGTVLIIWMINNLILKQPLRCHHLFYRWGIWGRVTQLHRLQVMQLGLELRQRDARAQALNLVQQWLSTGGNFASSRGQWQCLEMFLVHI